jgi:hypothetical protein
MKADIRVNASKARHSARVCMTILYGLFLHVDQIDGIV